MSIFKDDDDKNTDTTADLKTIFQDQHNGWKNEEEVILKEWADKALCYKWLHSQSHRKYSIKNAWFTIPVIILSTLTGTANFAQDKISDSFKSTYSMIIGSINIFAGIISTIAQYLKIAELNESHRIASISWDKFYRNSKIELAKNPCDRMPALQMLKLSKEEFDRLMEASPPIPADIVSHFNTKFGENDIIKPEICDTLISTKIYSSTAEENINLCRAKNKNMFIERFKTIKGRPPTIVELNEHVKENVTIEII